MARRPSRPPQRHGAAPSPQHPSYTTPCAKSREPKPETHTAPIAGWRSSRTMPVRHSVRKTAQIAAVRSQCGKHARTPCKIQTRPASSQRYNQSAAIWLQTTTAVRDKPSKRYDANWEQSTMGIKSVTNNRPLTTTVWANTLRLEEKPPVTMAAWQNCKTVPSEPASAPRQRSRTMPAQLFGHVLRHLIGKRHAWHL
jgi:hypothetical protein